jgi:SAM-dependent methyltransferase
VRKPLETNLDVCYGSGGSALPAAQAVGLQGKVVAVDLAKRLVGLGEAKARAKGLSNIEFKAADMLALGHPDASFDVVACLWDFLCPGHGGGGQRAVAHGACRDTPNALAAACVHLVAAVTPARGV